MPVTNSQTLTPKFKFWHIFVTRARVPFGLKVARHWRLSTETALLKLQMTFFWIWQETLNLLLFLDLNAAFDTVDHNILISRLKSSIGIRGNVLNWFSPYLMNRSQRVTFSGCVSNSFPLPQGVPQGLRLGQMLFTIYSSKMFHLLRNHFPDVHAYADDAFCTYHSSQIAKWVRPWQWMRWNVVWRT